MQIDFSSLFLSAYIYIQYLFRVYTFLYKVQNLSIIVLQSAKSHSSIFNPFFDFVQGWGIKPKRPIALFLPRLTRLCIPTGPHNNRNLFFFANFLILTLHTQVHNLYSLSLSKVYIGPPMYTQFSNPKADLYTGEKVNVSVQTPTYKRLANYVWPVKKQ